MRASAMPASHGEPVAAVAEALDVDPHHGLTTEEASRRLTDAGRNELGPPHRVSLVASIIDTATEPFVLLLALAGGLALLLGEVRDGLLILGGLVPIIGADVIVEFRAERALEELRLAAAPRAAVRRDGAAREIPAVELVPGDVVMLRVGDVVPADLRLARAEAMLIDRSVLTGESLPEAGRVEPDAADAALPDRHAIAYSGTAIVQGRGEGIVVATGARSELGRIAGALGQADRGRSPLQRELDRLVKILLVLATALIALTVGLNLVRGSTLGEAVLAGISAAIAAIPEEPPVLLAVVLGLGAYRLLRRGVLVRRLNAQETLGAVDLIITDKTGTLTENRLALEALLTPEGEVTDPDQRAALLLDALRAEEDAWATGSDARVASFTRSIRRAFGHPLVPRLEPADLVAAEPPRDDAPYSRTLARRDGELEELAIGAPEAVLALGGESPDAARWHRTVDASASAGRRLLLLSGRRDGEPWTPRAIVVFADHLRPGIPEAMRSASEAGIQVIVVTGDHPTTAAAIARAAGLSGHGVVTGRDVDAMDQDELARSLAGIDIVARATPEQKLRLVRAARDGGRTVAVTGDGVNDAPALQQADVAVAMGSGTAVAREAADLVLGDDSFVTLMDGLREGRRIVANVQKGLVFLTSTHVALLGFILIATIAGFGQPLLPLQILWAEVFIDVAASVAFEREPAEPDIMQTPPRPRWQPLLTNDLLLRIGFAGSVTAVAALALMVSNGGGDHARWLAFNALAFGQLVRAYMNRTLTHSIRRLRPNRFLLGACLVAGAITLLIPYVPPLADAFRATPLDAGELVLVAAVALGPAIVAEVVRSVRRTAWVA